MDNNLVADLQFAAPEVLLAIAGLVGVLIGAVIGDSSRGLIRFLGISVLVVASVLSTQQFASVSGHAFNHLYASSGFTSFAKVVLYGLAAVALFMSGRSLKAAGVDRYEYTLLLIFASLGGGLMLSAASLMTLYMGVEMMSLSSYVLAAFRRDNVRSAEAGLKYFVLGALASGLLLYGSSLVYGFSGSTLFDEINGAQMSVGLVFGMVLVMMGLAFKASAAPLHVWTPDVYEGAPAPVVAYFASAPKIAAVVVFANVMFVMFGEFEAAWRSIVSVIAAASMLVGAFGALMQNNIKKILAYSSISNVGFGLIAVAAGAGFGSSAVLVYMSLYVVATLGVFGGVLCLHRGGQAVESINDLNGLVKSKPMIGIGIMVLIFSIAGIPPAAGFWGKLAVFEAGIRADLLWLVIVGVISSVISLGYYLRIVWAIMMKPAADALDKTDWTELATVAVSALLVFPVLTIFIQRLLDVATRATLG